MKSHIGKNTCEEKFTCWKARINLKKRWRRKKGQTFWSKESSVQNGPNIDVNHCRECQTRNKMNDLVSWCNFKETKICKQRKKPVNFLQHCTKDETIEEEVAEME